MTRSARRRNTRLPLTCIFTGTSTGRKRAMGEAVLEGLSAQDVPAVTDRHFQKPADDSEETDEHDAQRLGVIEAALAGHCADDAPNQANSAQEERQRRKQE